MKKLLFKKLRKEIRELNYSNIKLIEKWKALDHRVTTLEREKTAEKNSRHESYWDKTQKK